MKKIRMGLESCEDMHDTTLRGDDYVNEPQESSNNQNNGFDDLISTSSVQPPSPTRVVVSAPQVSSYLHIVII